MERSLLQMDTLAAEVVAAESLAERLAVQSREKEVSYRYCSVYILSTIPNLESLRVLISKER
jgi:hypothetical protein